MHLGPGVTAQRTKEPSIKIEDLPRVDLICLSHYHECVYPFGVSGTFADFLEIFGKFRRASGGPLEGFSMNSENFGGFFETLGVSRKHMGDF